ncbi:MAG: hypothetical protein QOH63_937 [Acidobacteriota bacterium]|jgi:hypothetical protein|nr:hypothetical protein [Acidobacteriota bacterium]
MPYQNINVTISPADVQAVKDSFAAILEKLPFLINLTANERKALLKTGPGSLSFVQNASSAAQNNATIFPASFNTADFQKDVDLLATLTELGTLASSVASRIDDTRLAVGSEAMQQATQVYNYVKTAAKNTPGLKPLAEQLGERFQKSRKPKEPKPPSA